MDKLCEQFNNIVLSLISQISKYTNKSYESQFNMLIKINKVIPIERFSSDVTDYRTKIMERDEKFFYEHTYNEVEDNDGSIMDEIIHLKEIYEKLNQESISNIWDYLHAMIYLGDEYNNEKNKKIT